MSNAFGFYFFKDIFRHDSKQSPRALLGAMLVPEAWAKSACELRSSSGHWEKRERLKCYSMDSALGSSQFGPLGVCHLFTGSRERRYGSLFN